MQGLNRQTSRIGVLYPGTMGSAFGGLLARRGYRVVTTVEGRSERTRQLCREARLETVASLDRMVQEADIVVSLVSPAAAVEMAERFCDAAASLARPPLYVDANSIAPGTALAIDGLLTPCGIRFTDAALHGLANRLEEHGALFLSGPDACALGEFFGGVIPVRVLGDRPGTASLLKMLQSAVSKGVMALFCEIGAAAERAGLRDAWLDVMRRSYPETMALVDRLTPTVLRHAARRAAEMREVDETLASLGISRGIAHQVRQQFSGINRFLTMRPPTPLEIDATTLADLLPLVLRHTVTAQEAGLPLEITTSYNLFPRRPHHGE